MPDAWSTGDFDQMSWHDCHVHGFRIAELAEEHGTAELELDLDFIVEWRCREDRTFEFRIAPATLVFHSVFGLRFELDYVEPTAGMGPFSLDGIEREMISYSAEHTSYRWRLPINWPTGLITFESPGFTQRLRGEPLLVQRQSLLPKERGAKGGG